MVFLGAYSDAQIFHFLSFQASDWSLCTRLPKRSLCHMTHGLESNLDVVECVACAFSWFISSEAGRILIACKFVLTVLWGAVAEGEAQVAPVHVLDGNCDLRRQIQTVWHRETHSKYADGWFKCEFIAAPLAKYSDRRFSRHSANKPTVLWWIMDWKGKKI